MDGVTLRIRKRRSVFVFLGDFFGVWTQSKKRGIN